MQGISWLAEKLLASQEGLCSMEFLPCWDTSLRATVGQMLGCQQWILGGVVCVICHLLCCVYIKVRITFSTSECLSRYVKLLCVMQSILLPTYTSWTTVHMEAAHVSKMTVENYQSTQRHVSQDCIIYINIKLQKSVLWPSKYVMVWDTDFQISGLKAQSEVCVTVVLSNSELDGRTRRPSDITAVDASQLSVCSWLNCWDI
jgi:hypothetical protein